MSDKKNDLNEKINQLEIELKKYKSIIADTEKIASVGSWEWNISANKVTWSKELYRIYGLNSDDFGASFEAFINMIHPDDQEKIKSIIKNILENHKTVEFEERIIRPDNSIRYLQSKAEVIFDNHGKPVSLMGVCHDITDKREKNITSLYNQILEESNKRIVNVLESITDSFFSLDTEWRFTYINHQSEKLMGKNRDELFGKNMWDEFPTMISTDFYTKYHDAMKYQKSTEFEAFFPIMKRWFSVRAFPSPTSLSIYLRDITEDKYTKEKTRAEQEKFRLLTEAIPQIIWTANQDGKVDYYNPAWYEYTNSSSIINNWIDKTFVHYDDIENAELEWKKALKENKSFEFKCRFKRFSDNSYRWHLCRGLPIFNEQGNVIKWFGTSTDIDEQVRFAEVQKFLAETGSLLISSIDYETTLQNISKIAVPYFADWCAVDMVKDNKIVRLAVAHQDPEKVKLAKEFVLKYPAKLEDPTGVANVIRTGKSDYVMDIPYELIEAIQDPELKDYINRLGIKSYMVVPLKLKGDTIGAITFVNDRENRLYSEKDLLLAEDIAKRASLAIDNAYLYQKTKEAEENFRFLAETIPQQVWTALPDGALDYVNERITNYFNVSSEKIIGEGWINFIHPDDINETIKRWKNSLSTSENYETFFRLKNGNDNVYKWYIGRAFPLKDENGKVTKWFGTNTDINEQKKVEEKLDQKTIELENSNRELKHFAYIASHDLQEPLRTMSSYAGLIERRYRNNLDEDGKEFLDLIMSASVRMKNLIEDLLVYSQVGKKEFKTVNLNETLENVIFNLKKNIDDNNAEIISEKLPVIKAEPIQMLQLFQNIISNSIKYRNDTHPLIKISVTENKNDWLFSISDNGIGIEKAYFEKIFIIFQRLHEKGKYEGTGIGLATCKKIIELHNGKIWLESSEGKGSTFYFTISKNLSDE